jgi:hypothetical protein
MLFSNAFRFFLSLYCKAHNLEVNLKGLSHEMDYSLKLDVKDDIVKPLMEPEF